LPKIFDARARAPVELGPSVAYLQQSSDSLMPVANPSKESQMSSPDQEFKDSSIV
jgi:hypothetical protein